MDIQRFKWTIAFIVFFAFSGLLYGQDKKDEVEINYVWIDTMITIDETEVRIVSKEVTRITCCMKSPKYSRVSARAANWIRKTYDANYEGIPFKTLQNLQLAVEVVDAAVEKAESDDALTVVDYEYKCNWLVLNSDYLNVFFIDAIEKYCCCDHPVWPRIF